MDSRGHAAKQLCIAVFRRRLVALLLELAGLHSEDLGVVTRLLARSGLDVKVYLPFAVRGCLLGFIESALGFYGFTPRYDISYTHDITSTFAPAVVEVLLLLDRVHGIPSRA